MLAITQSIMRATPVSPFDSKPVFVSMLRPGGRGFGVGVTEGVIEVEETRLLDETSGVGVMNEGEGVAEEVVTKVLECATLEIKEVGEAATRVS